MKTKTIIKVLIGFVLFLSACQKNTDIFVPDPGQPNGPDTAWYNVVTATMPVSILKSNITIATHHDSIIAGSNIASVITPGGLQLNFPPNACINNLGQIITGKIDVEVLVVKTKGDMIRLNKPTTSDNRLLVSGGEIFINLKKNGLSVQLAPGIKYNIRYSDGVPNPLMELFVGDETNTEKFNWIPNPDTANNKLFIGSQSYEIYTNHLRWLNCDYFYDTAGIPRITVAAELPTYFTNANTVAFTVFKDIRSVVGMYGNVNTRKFSTGKLPAGKAITVVVISKQANDYYLGYESAVTLTTTTGNPLQPVPVKPIKKSLPDIIHYLSTL
ncbi:MAG TPA: hypothetical protein VK489_02805 [Ferruginibacter sp.]|nr:hypothetical protein [Ferruginibacter sp.]